MASAAVAEYWAMLAGLKRVHELGLVRVAARSDSRLLITHLKGERNIRNAALRAIAAEIGDLCTRIGTVAFEWIPADANHAAHEMVTRALQTQDR